PRLIGDAVGIRRDVDGQPILSAEGFRVLTAYKREDNVEVNVSIRGVGAKMTKLRPEFRIVEGRMFQPALTEIVVGRAANRQFSGLNIGDQVRTRLATWTVVGIFTTGDMHESEIMTDIDALNSAERRGGYQSVTVQLDSPGSFRAFKDSLSSN